MDIESTEIVRVRPESHRLEEILIKAFKWREIIKIGEYAFVVVRHDGVTFDLQSVTFATQAQWTGAGLPPVGTVCEHRTGPGMSWTQATVLAHGEKKCFYRDQAWHEWTRLYDEIEFRPILTEEQIAAEAREAGIKEMLSVCPYPGSHGQVARVYAEALYDANYRKQPTDQ